MSMLPSDCLHVNLYVNRLCMSVYIYNIHIRAYIKIYLYVICTGEK